MRRAIALSARGFPAPNPHVGCVIAQGEKIVGEGYHPYAGGPHAEVVALRDAGDAAKGSTAYVTLEPCNHHGRTPPCVDALLQAGVRRVVVACPDPNPVAAGGMDRLRGSGVEVQVGLLREEASARNRQFLHAMQERRPFVVVKAAASLDGRIALPSGESKWITGEAARRDAHRLRAECGAVLVGRGTVEADDPLLTARLPGVRNQPVRVVLDPRGVLTGRERVFDASAETMHVTGRIDLPELLGRLAKRGINGLLVEGGGTTIRHFFSAGLVDRVELYLAPKLLGDGRAWIEGLGLSALADAPTLSITGIKRLGPDLRVSAQPAFHA